MSHLQQPVVQHAMPVRQKCEKTDYRRAPRPEPASLPGSSRVLRSPRCPDLVVDRRVSSDQADVLNHAIIFFPLTIAHKGSDSDPINVHRIIPYSVRSMMDEHGS
jgi:hypothetical protein